MKIDIRNIIETPIRQVILWMAAVLVVTFVGKQPGVVCITPLAWLIALRVGIICAARSRSETRTTRLLEASLAGAVLGFLQGILFAVISTRMEPIGADDTVKAMIWTIVMIVAGMMAGGILSFITAYMAEQKKEQRV